MSASVVLASKASSTQPEATPPVSTRLRPCPRNGASWRAGVGRVRSLAILSILWEHFLLGCTWLFQLYCLIFSLGSVYRASQRA